VSRLVATVITIVAFLFTADASADDASRLGLRFHNIVAGDDLPKILIKPVEAASSVVIKLKRADGETSTLRAASLRPGVEKQLEVRQPLGSDFSYEGTFTIAWANKEKSEFQMRFKLVRLDELVLSFDKADVDLDKRTMSLKINRPATRVELTITGDGKRVLKTVTKDLTNHKISQKIHIAYPDPGANILFMDLRVYDQTGGFKGVHLTPVSTSIPHDDVAFDSGKWDIRPSQEPKLQATLKKIDAALAKFKKVGVNLELKLYVAGYTDTVGSKSSNRTLSDNRARAIATWFVEHGLKLDVLYQGFGEDILAKRTPDETDEPRNRRAVYVLATQTPGKGGMFPRTAWSPAK
jgi:outer membrane protein OmpA-like peptidoglycan-associated protein